MLRKVNSVFLCIVILINSILFTSCWNYREVDSMAIVSGAAIDIGEHARYKLTVEIVKLSGGSDVKAESKLISSEGDTMFDCVRNAIAVSGRKLYWSHNKFLIVSKELAQKGVLDMIDWFIRDAETRGDIHILVSTENTAEEIFNGDEITQAIKSFSINDVVKNEEDLSKAPKTEMWEFANNMAGVGISASAPTIRLKETDKGKIPSVGGMAVFKGDKLIGFLSEEETKDVLFIQNNIKGGLIGLIIKQNEKEIPVALEIFKSKTRVKPIIKKDNIKFNIYIEITVSLSELGASINLIDENGRQELIKIAETTLKKRTENTVRKIQKELGVDILGFGEKIYEDNNKAWKKVENNWYGNFKNVQVNVTAKIHIKNTSMLSKPLEVKEK